MRVLPPQHARPPRIRRSYSFLRRNWLTTFYMVMSGDALLHGLDDGGEDVTELSTSLENIGVISALFAGTVHSPLEQSASKAAYIDEHVPGLGTVQFWVAYTVFWIWCVTVAVSIFLLMILRNVPTQFESTYVISIARKELRLPYYLTFSGIFSTIIMVMLDTYTRSFQLDTPLPVTLEADIEAAGRALAKRKRANPGEDDGEVGGYSPASSLALGGDGIRAAWAFGIPFWTLLFFTFFFALVHKVLHARRVFRADDIAKNQDLALMATSPGVPWFSLPTADAIRADLEVYVAQYKAPNYVGSLVSPEHFREFVLRRERAKGHGDISYLGRRLIEQIFEEWEQDFLAGQSVKINSEELLTATAAPKDDRMRSLVRKVSKMKQATGEMSNQASPRVLPAKSKTHLDFDTVTVESTVEPL